MKASLLVLTILCGVASADCKKGNDCPLIVTDAQKIQFLEAYTNELEGTIQKLAIQLEAAQKIVQQDARQQSESTNRALQQIYREAGVTPEDHTLDRNTWELKKIEKAEKKTDPPVQDKK